MLERGRRQRDVEQLPADELAVGDGLAAARHDALADREARNRHAEARRGELQQLGTSCHSRRADAMAGARHRVRTADAACQTDDVRVVLRAERLPVLAVVDVPLIIWLRSTSSSSAATIRKPVEMPLPGSPWLVSTLTVLSALMRIHESSCRERRVVPGLRRRSGCTCLSGKTGTGEAEADDHRAAALEERGARELLLEHLGHGYFPPFAITAAAFWIAVRILGYVPQRQR